MNAKDTFPVSVRMPPDLLERIDVAAREERRTRSGQILWLLSTAIEAHRPPAPQQEHHA